MKNYALIETATSTVTNIIIWDGQGPWQPPDGFIAVVTPPDQGVSIGWSYVDGEFAPPPPVLQPESTSTEEIKVALTPPPEQAEAKAAPLTEETS